MKKKRLILISIIALVSSSVVYLTWAYFYDSVSLNSKYEALNVLPDDDDPFLDLGFHPGYKIYVCSRTELENLLKSPWFDESSVELDVVTHQQYSASGSMFYKIRWPFYHRFTIYYSPYRKDEIAFQLSRSTNLFSRSAGEER